MAEFFGCRLVWFDASPLWLCWLGREALVISNILVQRFYFCIPPRDHTVILLQTHKKFLTNSLWRKSISEITPTARVWLRTTSTNNKRFSIYANKHGTRSQITYIIQKVWKCQHNMRNVVIATVLALSGFWWWSIASSSRYIVTFVLFGVCEIIFKKQK